MRRQRGCEFGGPASGILTCNNELHVRISNYVASRPTILVARALRASPSLCPVSRVVRRLVQSAARIGEKISVDRAPRAIAESRWRTR